MNPEKKKKFGPKNQKFKRNLWKKWKFVPENQKSGKKSGKIICLGSETKDLEENSGKKIQIDIRMFQRLGK